MFCPQLFHHLRKGTRHEITALVCFHHLRTKGRNESQCLKRMQREGCREASVFTHYRQQVLTPSFTFREWTHTIKEQIFNWPLNSRNWVQGSWLELLVRLCQGVDRGYKFYSIQPHPFFSCDVLNTSTLKVPQPEQHYQPAHY